MDSAVARRSAKRAPRRTTLNGFVEEVAGTEGLNLHAAEPLVPILVTTRNSRYRLIPLRRGDTNVLVQGGRFFPEPAEARLVGATFGGSFLHMHWIRVGMCMEIDPETGEGAIITTRVIDVEIERDSTTQAGPH